MPFFSGSKQNSHTSNLNETHRLLIMIKTGAVSLFSLCKTVKKCFPIKDQIELRKYG